MKIEQIYISHNLKTNIPCNPSLTKYHNKSIPSFFCGLSNDEDIKCLESHGSYKIIIWHIIDTKILAKVKNIKQVYNLVLCDATSQVLQEHGIIHVHFPLNTNSIPDELLDTIFFEYDVNYYFDKIFIINLDRDVTKWDRMKTVLSKHKINNYARFSAIDGSKDPYLTEWKESRYKKRIVNPGILGNLYSVLTITQHCKKMGYKRFLLFEDDVIFAKNFSSDFRRLITNLNEVPWKLLYLGANDTYELHNPVNNLYHPRTNLRGGFATGIDSSVYHTIISICLRKKMPVDNGAFSHVINLFPENTFVAYPNLVIADVRKSGLRGSRDLIKFAKTRRWILDDYDI